MSRHSIAVAYEVAVRDSSRSLRGYLNHVVIDSTPTPRVFAEVAQSWQWDRVARYEHPFEYVAGLRTDLPTRRALWDTMPRGHDKTSWFARVCNWLLAFSKRRLSVVVAATDGDQAALLTDAMDRELRLNPWLRARGVTVQRRGAKGPGGEVVVATSDAPSAFGGRPDVTICDEVTHWESQDLWTALFSGRQKRWGSVFAVICNAGTLGSWQWNAREEARTSSDWSWYEAPGMLNTWMDADAIERDRRLLPPAEARRLFDNQWIDPAEESGYLTRADIEGCVALGRERGLHWKVRGVRGVEYVASIDYGPRRDRTALCVLHREADMVVVDRLDVWQGSPEQPVQIDAVEEWMEDVDEKFNRPHIIVDPYQLEGTIQRYEHSHRVQRFEARGGKANYELAENLRSLIVSKRLAWYAGAGRLTTARGQEDLSTELLGLVLKRMPYGYRFDHELTGHDDRCVAVGMAALVAVRDVQDRWVAPKPLQVSHDRPVESKSLSPLNIRTSERNLYGMGR